MAWQLEKRTPETPRERLKLRGPIAPSVRINAQGVASLNKPIQDAIVEYDLAIWRWDKSPDGQQTKCALVMMKTPKKFPYMVNSEPWEEENFIKIQKSKPGARFRSVFARLAQQLRNRGYEYKKSVSQAFPASVEIDSKTGYPSVEWVVPVGALEPPQFPLRRRKADTGTNGAPAVVPPKLNETLEPELRI